MIWHADGRFTRVEDAPCADYAAALAASWRLRDRGKPKLARPRENGGTPPRDGPILAG